MTHWKSRPKDRRKIKLHRMEVEDTISCIDRYPESESFGELVMDACLLWRRPGVSPEPKNVSGALKHDFVVQVLERIYYKKEAWFRVYASVFHEGETYPQNGWVKAQFLTDQGVKEKVFDRLYRIKRGT